MTTKSFSPDMTLPFYKIYGIEKLALFLTEKIML